VLLFAAGIDAADLGERLAARRRLRDASAPGGRRR
jgi:hypothetical protein